MRIQKYFCLFNNGIDLYLLLTAADTDLREKDEESDKFVPSRQIYRVAILNCDLDLCHGDF